MILVVGVTEAKTYGFSWYVVCYHGVLTVLTVVIIFRFQKDLYAVTLIPELLDRLPN